MITNSEHSWGTSCTTLRSVVQSREGADEHKKASSIVPKRPFFLQPFNVALNQWLTTLMLSAPLIYLLKTIPYAFLRFGACLLRGQSVTRTGAEFGL